MSVPDAASTVYDQGLTVDQLEHSLLGAGIDAPSAADAVGEVHDRKLETSTSAASFDRVHPLGHAARLPSKVCPACRDLRKDDGQGQGQTD